MQNPGSNSGQQGYYQQMQGNSNMMMLGYPPTVNEQQQRQQQQQQQAQSAQLMNMQGVSNTPIYSAGIQQNIQSMPFGSGPSSQDVTQSQIPFQTYSPQVQQQTATAEQQMNVSYQQQQQHQSQAPSQQQSTAQHQKASESASQQAKKEEAKTSRLWNSPPYSPEILNNLSKYSVSGLSNIGRELVQELLFRTYSLMTILTKPADRWHQQQGTGDPEQLLQYCEYILSKIAEIRARIDRKSLPKSIEEDEFIKMMADPSEVTKSEEQLIKEKTFNVQRSKLVKLNAALKNLDWMCMVSDPRILKKTDKT